MIQGIFIAVGLSLLNFIRRAWRPHDAVVGWDPDITCVLAARLCIGSRFRVAGVSAHRRR